MIRYVPIPADALVALDNDGNGKSCFAWWDTITACFKRFDQQDVWESWEDFEQCFRDHCLANSVDDVDDYLERYKRLMPSTDHDVLRNLSDYDAHGRPYIDISSLETKYRTTTETNKRVIEYLREHIKACEGHGCPECGEPDVDLAREVLTMILAGTS